MQAEGYAPEEDFLDAEATDDEEEEEFDGKVYEDEEADEVVNDEEAKRERERLKKMAEERQRALDRVRQEQGRVAGAGSSFGGGGSNAKNRLQYLLNQAEVFQHFIGPGGMKQEKKRGRKPTSGRHNTRSEFDEDAELLRDEEDTEGAKVPHRLQVQPSILTNVTMRDYQLQGLNWMIHLYDNGINGILADEMGLGKTLQTISLLAYLKEFRKISGPHLVIVPKSTLHNWCNEFKRFCPSFRVVKFHGNKDDRARIRDTQVQPKAFDVCVTSYEMVIKEKGHFRRFPWKYIIIDEAHRIKNVDSRLSQVVRLFRTDFRMLITGTPLQNNLKELWALLNFLLPEVFSSHEQFDEWFSKTGEEGEETEVVQQLHKLLKPFLLRRLKSDVEKGLPPKTEIILKPPMSAMQKQFYKAVIQKDVDALDRGADRSRLLNIVMQLRKCCNHPYLFQGAEPGPPFITGEHLVENAGKMRLLDKLLPKLQSNGSRVLIFSQMTRMLDILEDYCLYRGYEYCRIDGNTGGDEREQAIDDYNREGSSKFVFLLSTRAGGLGINLVTADIVILYDSDWNPQMDLQAMDRAHRIGQKKEVSVFRFCTTNSIEEKVIEKAYKKLKLDALVIQQGRLQEQKQTMNKEELQSMIKFGAEYVFSTTEDDELQDADIDALIAKGKQATKELNDKMQVFTENALKFSLGADPSLAYDYQEKEEDGLDIKALKSMVVNDWAESGDGLRRTRAGPSGAPLPLKPTKPREIFKRPQISDFQFFQKNRIEELFNARERFHSWQSELQSREAEMLQGGADPSVVGEMMEAMRTAGDAPPEFTDELQAEYDRLLQEGFPQWSKKDYSAFVKACERFGREDLASIATEIEGKTLEEVREYSAVFWSRYQELDDADKVIKAIEKGEEKLRKQKMLMECVARKVARYRDPYNELKVQYANNTKGKAFSEEEDRFLICKVNELGQNFDEIKAEIRKSWRFRFDWFFKSRTAAELQKRFESLVRNIEKEFEDEKGGKAPGAAQAKRKAAVLDKTEGTPSQGGSIPPNKKKAAGGGQ